MTPEEVIALLVKLGAKVGQDLVALARDADPRLRQEPIPDEDTRMDVARDALKRELGDG